MLSDLQQSEYGLYVFKFSYRVIKINRKMGPMASRQSLFNLHLAAITEPIEE